MFKKLLLFFIIFSLCIIPIASAETSWTSKPPLGSSINWEHPLSRGLVFCALMNEGGGNIVKDIAKTHNGVNTATWVSTIKGKGLQFPGVYGTRVTIPDSSDFAFTTGQSFTCIVYFIPSVTTNMTILRQDNELQSPRSIILIDTVSAKVRFLCTGNLSRISTVSGGTSIVAGLPYMAAGVRNVSLDKVQLYLNGKSDAADVTDVITETIDSDNPVVFGDHIASYAPDRLPFNGKIIFGYIYNRALSPSEIQQLYISPYCFIKQPSLLDYGAQVVAGYTGWVTITGD